MNTPKFILLLIVSISIGIFFGVLFTAYSKNNIQNIDNTFLSDGSQLSYDTSLVNDYSLNDESLDNIHSRASTLDEETSIVSDTPLQITMNTLTDTIKSIYLTGWSAGTESKRQTVIENMKNYGFNAVVIDIKDEAGQISYSSNVKTSIDISASKKMISNIQEVIQEFHDNDIYVIGRIVTFKDPTFAKHVPGIAYHKADGSLWQDYSGNNWPNPYNTDSWNYPIELAKEAANLGFDEIQFDYIRFPSSEGKTKNIAFGFESETKTKADIINSFLTKVMEELKDFDIVVSADVFGITTKKAGDFEHIGQDFQAIAKIVDVICPMIYPSHYGFGEYGIKAPDTKPYNIVYAATNDALKLYSAVSGDVKLAKIRPYLQDFTATWLKKGNYILYDTQAVIDQLKACYDLEIYDFTLWDPSNKYAYEALVKVNENKSGDLIISGDI